MNLALRGIFWHLLVFAAVAEATVEKALDKARKILVLMMATFVQDAGLSIITNRILGAGTEPKNSAWGTGAGTTTRSDTTLFVEAAEPRVAGTSTQQTTTKTNDTYQVIATMTTLSAQTITNAGLFDALVAGNLFLKGDFTGIPLSIGDSIQFTYKAQFTN